MKLEPLTFEGVTYKVAYLWVIPTHPAIKGFPGVMADLFFSSPEKFAEVFGDKASDEVLVATWVPPDFADWDYIPNEY